ncbi:hypothetical protein Ctha_0518 [Chloroherpeton thalassium ATCC 35110]|uniref:DUF3078 domain-containing protein n=2 Tax=Chloroherpeton thalassium TaxID=100716 RepID=B3QV35_CHLT3|nr:hypothetical protein Ctha_0518 [Chloroherpeton thalassium ATCC 35110]
MRLLFIFEIIARKNHLTQMKNMNRIYTAILSVVFLFSALSHANAQETKTTEVSTETVKIDTISIGADGSIETATIIRKIQKTTFLPDFIYNIRPYGSIVQVSFKDWAEGGINSVAWAAGLEANSKYIFKPFVWENRLELGFGQNKSNGESLRKTTDIIDFETNIRYGARVFKPEFVATLRTQFAPGYDYDTDGDPQISAFFDPAYLVQSIGMSYKHSEQLEASLGLAFREIITDKYTLFSDDTDTDEIESVDFKTGIRASGLLAMNVLDDIFFKSRLQLFSAFDQLDVWDVNSKNTLHMRINDSIHTEVGVYFLFQKNATGRLQIQQTFALSFGYAFSNI